MADLSEAILVGIKQLNDRFDKVDARLDKVEARLGKIDARFDRVDARFEMIENRLAPIEGAVAEIDTRLKSWPDMHYLSSAAKAQIGHTRDMKADLADLKVRTDGIFQSMATDAEIRNVRDDIAKLRDQSVEVDVFGSAAFSAGSRPLLPIRSLSTRFLQIRT